MDPTVKDLIDRAKVIATGITDMDRNMIIALLSIEPGSEESDRQGH